MKWRVYRVASNGHDWTFASSVTTGTVAAAEAADAYVAQVGSLSGSRIMIVPEDHVHNFKISSETRYTAEAIR